MVREIGDMGVGYLLLVIGCSGYGSGCGFRGAIVWGKLADSGKPKAEGRVLWCRGIRKDKGEVVRSILVAGHP